MGLVEYSDSESDSETISQPVPKPTPTPAASTSTSKKPFQRIVDRSKPGKIVVSLPGATAPKADSNSEEPPAKRPRIGRGAGGGGAFSGFNSFLPPPKNAGKPALSSSSGKAAARPGVNLKTGATPGFTRSTDVEDGDDFASESHEHNKLAEPSIPAEQKPADEVKLVGKPMMFKPLSVSRKPAKSKPAASKPVAATASKATVAAVPDRSEAHPSENSATIQATEEPPKKKKKMSLFSITQETDEIDHGDTKQNSNGVYEPVFADQSGLSTQEAFAQYDAQFANEAASSSMGYNDYQQPLVQTNNSLDSIASDMNLSAAARRELFGRRGAPDPSQSASRVINFNTDHEYAANEELRASGQAQPTYNPVRAIAPGKHNLRQLVNQVQNQREALEESFAKGHRNRTEASSKYGWR